MKRNEKKPTPHAVYVVEGEGDKALWTKIVAAWAHYDGRASTSARLTVLNGRLALRAGSRSIRSAGRPRRWWLRK